MQIKSSHQENRNCWVKQFSVSPCCQSQTLFAPPSANRNRFPLSSSSLSRRLFRTPIRLTKPPPLPHAHPAQVPAHQIARRQHPHRLQAVLHRPDSHRVAPTTLNGTRTATAAQSKDCCRNPASAFSIKLRYGPLHYRTAHSTAWCELSLSFNESVEVANPYPPAAAIQFFAAKSGGR